MKVFHDGMPAWKKTGKLIISEPHYLTELITKDIAHVLIDLRPATDAQNGFIPGAVNIPFEELAAAKERFPGDTSAPIILYGSGKTEEAFRTVRGWGFKETSVLDGGVDGWKKSGGLLSTDKMKTDIVYLPKPRPGEISVDEFKLVAEKGDPNKVILDVRDSDEAMNGMLRGAINIPVDRLTDRSGELPKDKEIITHCTTGIRAEMAYEDLKEKGLKARFLNAVIQVDKDGKYEITKK